MLAIAAVILATALAGCGSGSSEGFTALVGKRIPGTGSTWLPIANHINTVRFTVAGTSASPLITWADATEQSVEFFDFPNSAAASAFYARPPFSADLMSSGVRNLYQSIPGKTGVPGPSRLLELRDCTYLQFGTQKGAP